MQIRTWFGCALLMASFTATACGSRQRSAEPAPSAPPPAQTAHAPGGSGGECPMMIDPATTQVTASDTSDGIALVFTTSGDVAELRARVRRMADMHNQMAGMHGGGTTGPGGMHGGGMHGGHGTGPMHMHMVPSRASVEDVPGGARLLLVPTDPAQLAALRQQARMHADMMAKGQCPMAAPAPAPEPGAEHE